MKTPANVSYRRKVPSESVVLLNALLSAVEPQAVEAKPVSIDWDQVIRRAELNRIAPWVSEFVEGPGAPLDAPAEVVERLRRDALECRAEFEVKCRQFEEVAWVFEERGIAFLPLHGIVFGKRLYPRPYRQLSHFDILINSEDVTKATEGFLEAGFQAEESLLRRGEVEVRLQSELAFNLAGDAFKMDAQAVWSRASSREGSQYDVPFEDHAVLAAARAASSGACMEDWLDCVLADRAVPDLCKVLETTPILDATPSERWMVAGFVKDLREILLCAPAMEIPMELATPNLIGLLQAAGRVAPVTQPHAPTYAEKAAQLVTSLRRILVPNS